MICKKEKVYYGVKMKSTSNFLPLEVLSLLSVDLFTILLIFVIASQSNQMPMGKYCLSLILIDY